MPELIGAPDGGLVACHAHSDSAGGVGAQHYKLKLKHGSGFSGILGLEGALALEFDHCVADIADAGRLVAATY